MTKSSKHQSTLGIQVRSGRWVGGKICALPGISMQGENAEPV